MTVLEVGICDVLHKFGAVCKESIAILAAPTSPRSAGLIPTNRLGGDAGTLPIWGHRVVCGSMMPKWLIQFMTPTTLFIEGGPRFADGLRFASSGLRHSSGIAVGT